MFFPTFRLALYILLVVCLAGTQHAVTAQRGNDARTNRQRQFRANNANPNPPVRATPIASPLGTVTGLVLDSATTQPLAGATVQLLKDGQLVGGALTDADGSYSLPNLQPGTYVLRITYPEYNTRLLSALQVQQGQQYHQVVVLAEASYEVGVVVIETTASQASEAAAVQLMRQSTVITDVYSGQQVLQTASGLTLNMALQRLPGVLYSEETGMVIRGLSQRNNTIMLNSAPLLVTNLERQTFDFSLLPAGMISRVQLIKSLEPGTFSNVAGGIVMFETPDMPEKNRLTFNYQSGINTQSSFRNTSRYEPTGNGQAPGLFTPVQPLPSNFPSSNAVRQLGPFSDQLAQYGRQINLDYEHHNAFTGPNHNASVRYDGVYSLGKRRLGLVAALGFSNQHRVNNYEMNIVRDFDPELGRNPITDSSRNKEASHQLGAAALLNLTLELKNGKIGFRNLLSRTQMNQSNESVGAYIIDADLGEFGNYIYTPNRLYRQTLGTSQIGGEHYFGSGTDPKNRIKLDWNLFTTQYHYTDPAYQALNYLQNPDNGEYYLDTTLAEDYMLFGLTFNGVQTSRQYGAQTSVTLPVKLSTQSRLDLRLGGFVQLEQRRLRVRKHGLFPDPNGTNLDPDFLHISNTANYYTSATIRPNGFALQDLTRDGDNYNSRFVNLAPFANAQARLGRLWLLQAGARVETFRQHLTDYPVAGGERQLATVDLTDVLPMAMLRFTPHNSLALKAGYSRTVIRPDARELSDFEFFNLSTSYRWRGNPNLVRTQVDNTDLRVEYYPGGNDIISLSLFTKHFHNPIEQYIESSSTSVIYLYSLTNRTRAIVGGIEMEVRKNLAFLGSEALRNLVFYANATVLQSRIDKSYGGLFSGGRSLQGQSPYLVNAGLFYQPTG